MDLDAATAAAAAAAAAATEAAAKAAAAAAELNMTELNAAAAPALAAGWEVRGPCACVCRGTDKTPGRQSAGVGRGWGPQGHALLALARPSNRTHVATRGVPHTLSSSRRVYARPRRAWGRRCPCGTRAAVRVSVNATWRVMRGRGRPWKRSTGGGRRAVCWLTRRQLRGNCLEAPARRPTRAAPRYVARVPTKSMCGRGSCANWRRSGGNVLRLSKRPFSEHGGRCGQAAELPEPVPES